MAISSPNPTVVPVSTTTPLVVARVPYLNCAPFFAGLELGPGGSWAEVPPRQFGAQAAEGRVIAGPMSLVDYLRLQDQFERLRPLGIATRGHCGSALLFSCKPVRQLDGATIGVTDETSTSALLLRLILEQRYQLSPKVYQRWTTRELTAHSMEVDAVLLIGDEALRFRAANRWYPYELDLGFEWWIWQHRPTVFAVWAIRKDAEPAQKQFISRAIQHQLALNLSRLDEVAASRADAVGMSAKDVKAYLESFIYRFSAPEEEAIVEFTRLLDAHRLR